MSLTMTHLLRVTVSDALPFVDLIFFITIIINNIIIIIIIYKKTERFDSKAKIEHFSFHSHATSF
jgi:ABC-type uncharacterized transport system substrate-binding protein